MDPSESTARHFLNADLDSSGAANRQLASALARDCTALQVREDFASLELLDQPVTLTRRSGDSATLYGTSLRSCASCGAIAGADR